jgi:hypothetical protein
VVADHARNFRRDQIIYDPWHYLPVLVKKPGALRNGAPFKEWDLPPALAQVRQRLKHHPDSDRQFVKVLGRVLDHGLDIVEHCCHAWNKLVDQPWTIMSIGLRDWVHG